MSRQLQIQFYEQHSGHYFHQSFLAELHHCLQVLYLPSNSLHIQIFVSVEQSLIFILFLLLHNGEALSCLCYSYFLEVYSDCSAAVMQNLQLDEKKLPWLSISQKHKKPKRGILPSQVFARIPRRFQDSSNEGKTAVKVITILHENKDRRLKTLK